MKVINVTVTDTKNKDYKQVGEFKYPEENLEDTEYTLTDLVSLAESAKAWILSKLVEE